MKYLLDSDWTINFLNRRQRYRDLLEPLRREGIAISSLSVGEVLTGIIGQDYESEKLLGLKEFLKPLIEIPFDTKMSLPFAKIRRNLLDRHSPLENFDTAIAATALEYNLTLLTDNMEHFRRVPGLKVFKR